jgi:hypothetical protein
LSAANFREHGVGDAFVDLPAFHSQLVVVVQRPRVCADLFQECGLDRIRDQEERDVRLLEGGSRFWR